MKKALHDVNFYFFPKKNSAILAATATRLGVKRPRASSLHRGWLSTKDCHSLCSLQSQRGMRAIVARVESPTHYLGDGNKIIYLFILLIYSPCYLGRLLHLFITAMTIRHKCIDADDWLLLSCIPIGCRLRSLREKQNRFYCCVFLRKDCLRQLRDLRLRTFVFACVIFLR